MEDNFKFLEEDNIKSVKKMNQSITKCNDVV